MKKLTLFAFASFLLFNYGCSQTIKSLSLSGGYVSNNHTGRHYSSEFDYNYTDESEPLSGWSVEVGTEFWRSKFFSFSTRLGYIKKGSQKVYSNGTFKSRTKDRYNYIYFSPRVDFRYKTKYVIPYIFIAPRVDYFVSARSQIYSNNELVWNYGPEYSLAETSIKRYVAGFNFGAGVEKEIYRNISASIDFNVFRDITFTSYSENEQLIASTGKIVKATSTLKSMAFVTSLTIKYNFTKS